jgi:hypothetical protein
MTFHHFTFTRRALLISGLGALAACASNDFVPSRPTKFGTSLKGSKLQIYSFLDVRSTEFGPHLIDQFDRQLGEALSQEGVPARVLRFADSETGKYFTLSNSGLSVPVKQTIQGNLVEEQSFGANYRLVVFPANMRLQGAWRFYDIQWEITDVVSGQSVWNTVSHGKLINAWKNDEDPAERAKTFVDGFISALRSSNLV